MVEVINIEAIDIAIEDLLSKVAEETKDLLGST